MGLINWLMGKNKTELGEDRIWLTQDAKNAGIHKEVTQAVANPSGPSSVIVVAHFNDCLEQLQTAVTGFDQDRVFVTLADALADRKPTDLAADESRSILIIVCERHPLPSHDDTLMDFARSLPGLCRIVYHLSLEDSLLKRFSSEWLEGGLRKLGMTEDKAIENRMVGRRIQFALQKIARRATGDEPANSAKEWLERNCP
jgi:hypothetical protein